MTDAQYGPRRIGLVVIVAAIMFGGVFWGTQSFGTPMKTVDHCPDSEFSCPSNTWNHDANYLGWAAIFVGMVGAVATITIGWRWLFFGEGPSEVIGS